METRSLKVEIAANNNINIVFSSDDILQINTSGDIDLTDYVNKLFKLISDAKKLSIDKFESDNSKLNLVQNTIEEIAESLNECIEELAE